MTSEQTGNPYKWWNLRCWHGMGSRTWMKLLFHGPGTVSSSRVGLAFTVTGVSLMNSLLSLIQEALYGRRLARVDVNNAPLFVLGHWRSGTTYLHELLAQDDRFSYPDTYACLAPLHFVLTRRFVVPWMRHLLPRIRPMDNMPMGWDVPWEDEFALLNMGLPSIYRFMAYPNQRLGQEDISSLTAMDDVAEACWERAFLWFLKRISYPSQKPLVLKSPMHAFRSGILQRLFPEARFVHIIRNPYGVFLSTVRLWEVAAKTQGLQVPRDFNGEEFVLTCYERMYAAVKRIKVKAGPTRFHEVRYEDLVRDPLEELRRIYHCLNLGPFDPVVPRLKAYLDTRRGYRTNPYTMRSETCAKITRRWSRIIEEYGYPLDLGPSIRSEQRHC